MFPADSNILIVDDSSFARTMIKNSLKELNFNRILEAADAREARALLEGDEQIKNPVHLIICDLHMPEIRGMDFLRWVRQQDRLKDTPVIVLTASQEKTDVLDAGKLGVTNYMIKPFDTNQLKERMTSTWQRHGARYYESLKKT